MNILTDAEARRELYERWEQDPSHARRAVDIAREHGVKAVPVTDGYVTITRVNNNSYVIERGNKERPPTRDQVAQRTAGRYTQPVKKSRPAVGRSVRSTTPAQGRTKKMATKAADPEVEEAESGEKDYTGYADKAPTATMSDFAEWLVDEVYGGKYPGDEDDFVNGVRLGGTLRMEFQRSEFNIQRREERRQERAAAAEAEPEEEEAPAPKRAARGKTAATKAAPAKAAPAKAAGTAPKRRGRTAKASAEAPY